MVAELGERVVKPVARAKELAWQESDELGTIAPLDAQD